MICYGSLFNINPSGSVQEDEEEKETVRSTNDKAEIIFLALA